MNIFGAREFKRWSQRADKIFNFYPIMINSFSIMLIIKYKSLLTLYKSAIRFKPVCTGLRLSWNSNSSLSEYFFTLLYILKLRSSKFTWFLCPFDDLLSAAKLVNSMFPFYPIGYDYFGLRIRSRIVTSSYPITWLSNSRHFPYWVGAVDMRPVDWIVILKTVNYQPIHV